MSIKVLLVDDEVSVSTPFSRLLSKDGELQVDTAECGNDALDKIRTDSYDVVVTDMMMHNGNGDTVLNYIKMKEVLGEKAPKAIVLTGINPSESLMKEWLKKGVTKILHKPCGYKELLQVIKGI